MVGIGKRVGQNIRVARTEAGLTQTELAERLGIHQESVSRWERGTVTPSVSQVFRIAEALGIDAAWLMMRGRMEQGEIAEELRTQEQSVIHAITEQAKQLPPESRRELVKTLMDLL